MNLRPHATEDGLWVNSDWQMGQPGTFAVIVGVSRYDHLKGGSSPANDMYDLGQLHVSALTAYRFFCWLRDLYQYKDCPLAKCWLLLSPSQDEVMREPSLQAHTKSPTFQACEEAIVSWFAEMKSLQSDVGKRSRGFFFFSGHGLEITRDKQVLLPCDYLKPPAGNVDRAISSYNLYAGLASLQVPQQFFFLDACRNDHQRLLGMGIQGTRILNEDPSYRSNPSYVAPLIYATATGAQAWQPQSTNAPSLFGQALLEGLEAREGLKPDCSSPPCVVKVFLLEPFLNRRVPQLIHNYGSQVQQPVRIGGVVADAPITEVTERAAPAPTLQPPAPLPPQPTPPPPEPPSLTDLMRRELIHTKPLVDWHPLQGPPYAHDVFGSEKMEEIWNTAAIYNLSQRKWLENSSYRIHQVDHDQVTKAYRIELSIPVSQWSQSQDAHWLALTDQSNTTYACILPGDTQGPPHYLLELNFEYAKPDEIGRDHKARWISRLEVALAPRNQPLLAEAAGLWAKYRTASLVESVKAYEAKDMSLAQLLVHNKFESPLAATVAAIVLLRARRRDLLHDWLRNLAEYFPDRPDGAVLWNECFLQEQAKGYSSDEVTHWLLQLGKRGLPHLAETFGYAARQAYELLEFGKSKGEVDKQLRTVQRALDKAGRYFRSGGLLSVFACPKEFMKPELVLPPAA